MQIHTIEKKLNEFGLDFKTMSELYFEKENKELCSQFNITNPTLVKWLKYLKIKPKGKGNRKPKKNEAKINY